MADGLALHLARLRRIAGPALGEAVDTALRRSAEAVADAARDAAGEGSLADGIEVVPIAGGAEVRSTAPHAAAMEYGTSTSPGRPHLAPAVARERSAAVAAVSAAVRRLVRGS